MGFGCNPSRAATNSAMASMSLSGDKRLMDALYSLPAQVRRKCVAKAMNAGGGILKRAIETNAQKHYVTGTLAKSIVVKRVKPKRPGSFLVIVGPKNVRRAFRRTNKGKLRGVSDKKIDQVKAEGTQVFFRNPAKYAHLVEFGHAGKRKAKPHPFMRPAFDAVAQTALDVMLGNLWTQIHREMKRMLGVT